MRQLHQCDPLVFEAASHGLTGLLALAALVLSIISLRIRARETPGAVEGRCDCPSRKRLK
jgi:hypothetical protein